MWILILTIWVNGNSSPVTVHELRLTSKEACYVGGKAWVANQQQTARPAKVSANYTCIEPWIPKVKK